MQSHAALPTPMQVKDSLYRIYFSSRDERNRSHVGYFDVDLENPERVLRVSEKPVLEPGPLGYFDDHGVYAASVVRHCDRIYMYTIGWNPALEPPLFYASIGLAVSEDGGSSFEKVGNTPIMTRSDYDPCLVTSPVVLKDNDRWRMWYVSGYRWEESGNSLQSHYHIKYAESDDGMHWNREGTVCIDHIFPGEKNIARACVHKSEDLYCSWYSYNCGYGYRIGYAESRDGIRWKRKDGEVGIDLSDSGWDSEAMAYPYVIEYGERLFMFYNGNGFGRDGVGMAVANRADPDR